MIADIPIKFIHDRALNPSQHAVSIGGDVGLTRANLGRAIVERQVNTEGVVEIRLWNDDQVVTGRRNRRRRQFCVRMIVLIVEAHVSRHRIVNPIIEIGNHARALSRRHQPDERLEVE